MAAAQARAPLTFVSRPTAEAQRGSAQTGSSPTSCSPRSPSSPCSAGDQSHSLARGSDPRLSPSQAALPWDCPRVCGAVPAAVRGACDPSQPRPRVDPRAPRRRARSTKGYLGARLRHHCARLRARVRGLVPSHTGAGSGWTLLSTAMTRRLQHWDRIEARNRQYQTESPPGITHSMSGCTHSADVKRSPAALAAISG